ILSLSNWDGEKALVRWRTHAGHHEVQEKGRGGVFADYHLRVGQLTEDTQLASGHELVEQRLDETVVGEGTTVTLISAHPSPESLNETSPVQLASELGLTLDASALVSWDVFDAVLSPGDVVLLISWRDHAAAELFRASVSLPDDVRLREVRIVRDY